MPRFSRALAFACVFVLATPLLTEAQVRARGQIFLPNGQAIGGVTRIILSSEDARRAPEYLFTDSQGRIFLQGLAANQWYTITVESDGQSYATTVERFRGLWDAYIPVHLKPLSEPRTPPSPLTVSASRLGHQPPAEALNFYLQAMRAIENKKPEQAAKRLRRAVELDPGYVDAYNELAMGEKKYAEAESFLRRALAKDPEAPHPLLNLGITLDYLGRYADAVEPLQKLLQLRPQWLAPHAYLGIALLETDQVTEAEPHLQQATRADPREQALAYLYLGKLYAQTGERDQAIAAWTSYLEKDPDSPNATRVRALLAELAHPPQKP